MGRQTVLRNKQNEEDPTMRKKLLTLFLAVTMALSLVPAPARAAVLDPERHRQRLKPILDVLPTDLRRPACPTTVLQVIWNQDVAAKWDDSLVQEIADLANSLTAGKSTDREKMKGHLRLGKPKRDVRWQPS